MKRIDCVDTGAPRGSDPGPESRLEGGSSAAYSFHRAAVAPWIVKKASLKPYASYDSAIVDPPREGLGPDLTAIAQALESFGVKEIVAVGCDPDAWAKDLSKFVRRGWKLEIVAILDLFPQTPHVESLAVLRR
jgi:tRNA/tmRNA/rRNA uracil-C5-methylase (TrmA/RlmC/RlmD family)